MFRTILSATSSGFVVMLGLMLGAQQALGAEGFNLGTNGIGAKGYDVVAYFDGRAVPGQRQFTVAHEGVTYRFSTLENADRFSRSPEAFAPEFGGYCAYGVRVGRKFDVDPTAYQVHDQRLYLLLNHGTLALWREAKEANIAIAESIWPVIQPLPADSLGE